jgi:hypothetical protein
MKISEKGNSSSHRISLREKKTGEKIVNSIN